MSCGRYFRLFRPNQNAILINSKVKTANGNTFYF